MKLPIILFVLFLILILNVKAFTQNNQASNSQIVSKDNQEINTIGIGFFVDTLSNIATQYYVYSLLNDNPIKINGVALTPKLTLRKGITEYYINGTLDENSVKCNVWHNKKLVRIISVKNDKWANILSEFHNELSTTINHENGIENELASMKSNSIDINNCKSIRYDLNYHYKTNFGLILFPGVDIFYICFGGVKHMVKAGELISVSHNMLFQANNVTPTLNNPYEIRKEFLFSTCGLDSSKFNYFFSDKFRDILKQKKYLWGYTREMFGYGGKTMSRKFRKYKRRDPEYLKFYISYVNMQRAFSEKNISDPIKAAKSVFGTYKNNDIKAKLFARRFRKYVGEKMLSEARKIIYPLWKRPGTVLTFMQSGDDLFNSNNNDAAIECYMSALLMVDGLNVPARFKEYLKVSLFKRLSNTYKSNNEFASAYVCDNLSVLHNSLKYSNLLNSYDIQFKKLSDDLSQFFCTFEQKSVARTEVIGNQILSLEYALGGLATAYSYGSNLNASSSAAFNSYKQYMQGSADYLNESSQVDNAAVVSSGKIAQFYDSTFIKIVSQIQDGKSLLSATKPYFAMDFVQILMNGDLAAEQRNSIISFANSIPSLKPLIASYFGPNVTTEDKIKLVKTIYNTFAKLELTLFAIEASGKPSKVENVQNN
jgi:hypothetical protein